MSDRLTEAEYDALEVAYDADGDDGRLRHALDAAFALGASRSAPGPRPDLREIEERVADLWSFVRDRRETAVHARDALLAAVARLAGETGALPRELLEHARSLMLCEAETLYGKANEDRIRLLGWLALLDDAIRADRRASPHGPSCPCDSSVETRAGTERLPCPAIWDAYHPGVPFGPSDDRWWVGKRIEGRASTGVMVWSWWQRDRPDVQAPAPRSAETTDAVRERSTETVNRIPFDPSTPFGPVQPCPNCHSARCWGCGPRPPRSGDDAGREG